MTTRELALAHFGVSSFVKRHRRSVVTLGLTLLGFLAGESRGQQVDSGCSSCRTAHIPGAGTAVRGLDPSRSFLEFSPGFSAPSHDPWLVEAGWSGAYYAPQY
jgi:hypothetical protein